MSMQPALDLPASRLFSWTGEFLDREREDAYCTASLRETLGSSKLCILATTISSLAFIPMDVMMLDEPRLMFFLGIRALLAVLCIAVLFGLNKQVSHQRVTWLTYAQIIPFFFLNGLIFDHPALTRHGGLLLPLIAISMPMYLPGRFWMVALTSAYAPLVSLLFWGVLRPQPETPLDLASIFLAVTVGYVAGSVARVQLNRMRREEFLRIDRERQINEELRQAKDEAEAGARVKADFLAVMSHEIRTPLNGVLGMVRLAQAEELPPVARTRLEILQQSAEALATILDDVLDLSKLETGTAEHENVPLDLQKILQDVMTLVSSKAQEKGLSVRLDLHPEVPRHVAGDPARLRQILLNLAGNAVKFTEKGSVSITVDLQGQLPGGTKAGSGALPLRFSVRDTGIGISQDEMPRLFQPFSQADASIRRRYGGSGLGLVICKRLAEAMGGSVSVTSVKGEGSCFQLNLPMAPASGRSLPEAAAELGAGAPAGLVPLQSLAILLVEDNPVNQLVASGLLEREGHVCTVADSGEEALKLVQTRPFDVVLMDLQMPGMDGYETCGAIRALGGAFRHLPIIALTANALPEDRRRSQEAGMDGHLEKPVRPEVLNDMLQRAASRRQAQERASAEPRPLRPFNILPGADMLIAGDVPPGLPEELTGLGYRVFPLPDVKAAQHILAVRPFPVMILFPRRMGDVAVAQELCEGGMRLVTCACGPAALDELQRLGVEAAFDCGRAEGKRVRGLAEELGQLLTGPASSGGAGHEAAAPAQLLGEDRLAQLKILFLENLKEQLQALRKVDAGSVELQRIAHRVKGSAANMGYTDLQHAAGLLLTEKAAPSNGAIDELSTALRAAIEELETNAGAQAPDAPGKTAY
ncbi:Aerobic respiration control sensor protein ArcB [Pannonibacter phragmitetus]|uniref:histidine kinase n=1 Tax=Pannonibacter phragmitetus TaxID=121719 RepID=A0A378ZZB9_9HYPH|nr:hybrid sensor histidine kinase/response regulator [Pannonibacter phragmitetus]SUB02438.1 Aerobic respiration control sensor protein ArcB [Pannonibacter phragmitetus]